MQIETSDVNQNLLSSAQRQLIELLIAELDGILASQDSWAEHTLDGGAETWASLGETVLQFGRAADIVGLRGLRVLSDWVVAEAQLSGASLQNWLKVTHSYLQAIQDGGLTEKSRLILLDFAKTLSTQAAPEFSIEYLNLALDQTQITVEAREDAYPNEISHELSDIAIPLDVRPELWEGFKKELPQQSEAFSSAVEHYLHTHDASYLLNAQRVAHTIKGAANVVGVYSIATLMHFCEDLLETRQHILDDVVMSDLLVEATDILSEASDYLLGYAPKPENIASVLNRLLASLRASDEEPLPRVSPTQSASPATDEVESALNTGDLAVQLVMPDSASLVTPVSVSDVSLEELDAQDGSFTLTLEDKEATDLLRMAGELQIANTQLQTKLQLLEGFLVSGLRYQAGMQDLLADFDRLAAQQMTRVLAQGQELDPLEMDRYSELNSLSNRLQELLSDTKESSLDAVGTLDDLKTLASSQRQQGFELQDKTLAIRLLPVSVMASRFARAARQAARLTQKSVQFELLGEEVLVDSRVLLNLIDPIMHLLRNAIDHGIESSAAVRQQAGKTPQGHVTVSFSRQGDVVCVSIEDDGVGLNYERIYEQALAQGLLSEGEPLDAAKLHHILLLPGFSTRTTVSQTSGRGIGLDVVSEQVRKLKGQLHFVSNSGSGTRVDLRVPMSVISMHLLVVKTFAGVLALTSRGVDQIVYATQHEVLPPTSTRQAWHIHLGNQQLPVFSLNTLLGADAVETGPEGGTILIVSPLGAPRYALWVDKIISSDIHVVKALPPLCYRPPAATGAVILGTGDLAPVLDVTEILAESIRFKQSTPLVSRSVRSAPPLVLVADDSLSARRAVQLFMQDMGYEVVAAKDGFEALQKLEGRLPILALIDLEMPRMNGLELAAHFRSHPALRNVPIIMISSRTTTKHRQWAEESGVTAYVPKPWTEEQLLHAVQVALSSVVIEAA